MSHGLKGSHWSQFEWNVKCVSSFPSSSDAVFWCFLPFSSSRQHSRHSKQSPLKLPSSLVSLFIHSLLLLWTASLFLVNRTFSQSLALNLLVCCCCRRQAVVSSSSSPLSKSSFHAIDSGERVSGNSSSFCYTSFSAQSKEKKSHARGEHFFQRRRHIFREDIKPRSISPGIYGCSYTCFCSYHEIPGHSLSLSLYQQTCSSRLTFLSRLFFLLLFKRRNVWCCRHRREEAVETQDIIVEGGWKSKEEGHFFSISSSQKNRNRKR